jgi:hypothetical protein
MPMISKVKFLTKKFHGSRTAYSSSSIFVAILSDAKQKYDHEIIGKAIFPNGFGCINPPGPSFGFGTIVLKDNEDDGKVKISILKKRKDYDGKNVSSAELKSSLGEYFDGFFIFNKKDQCLLQISFDIFYTYFNDAKEFDTVHFCEFEPDEE